MEISGLDCGGLRLSGNVHCNQFRCFAACCAGEKKLSRWFAIFGPAFSFCGFTYSETDLLDFGLFGHIGGDLT